MRKKNFTVIVAGISATPSSLLIVGVEQLQTFKLDIVELAVIFGDRITEASLTT